jgi:hypothetical protein
MSTINHNQPGGGGRYSKLKLNVLQNLIHVPIDVSKLHRSKEAKFSSKLVTSPLSREHLRVYTFPNEICLLTLSELVDVSSIKSIEFLVNVTDESISGKRKRGAALVKSGQQIAVIHNNDGSDLTVSTPIGGFLLEINSKIVSEKGVSLLVSDTIGAGYIAVIKPNTQFPTSDYPTFESLASHLTERQERVCFSWKSSGTCQYAGGCKFKHPAAMKSASADTIAADSNISICETKRKIDDI